MKSAIVIGAGLAGLTAGYRLKQAGWTITVLESTDRVCGRVNTFGKNGYLIDGGPTAVADSYICYLQLMRELGLADALVDSSSVIGVVRNGALHTIDTHRPLAAFLRTRALSWPEKLRLAVGMPRLLKVAAGAELTNALGHTRHDTESIAAFLSSRFDAALIENVFDPMARVVTLGSKHDTSCLELFAGMGAARGKLVNVRGGLETLPRALARQLDVRLGRRAIAVRKQQAGVSVQHVNATDDSDAVTLTADACVITAPFFRAVEMCPQLGEEGAALARFTRAAPCYVVHLGYAAATQRNPYVVALPSRESPHISAIFLEHNKAPDRAPPGHSLVMLYYCPESVPVVSAWSEEEMVRDARARTEALFPELRDTLDMHNVQYFERASHYGPVGYYKAVRDFLERRAPHDPVQVAGDFLSIPGQETAVAWGERAARNLLTQG